VISRERGAWGRKAMEMSQVVTVILAGSRASQLEPLTRERAKPAIPFGGAYRIVDFPLSNCLNSGLRKTLLLTQFESLNLERHINLGWQRYFHRESGEFIDVVPPQQRLDESWYKGTADAIYQNIYSLEKEHPERVLILAGDHIYKMDYRSLVEFHVEKKADVTIGALRSRLDALPEGFGVLEVDSEGRVIGVEEVPIRPRPIPGDEQHCLTSMGVYVFKTRFLFEHLCRDATRPDSQHDLGGDLVPSIIPSSRVFAFPFEGNSREKTAYWRDMGTLDAYFEANMDLVSVDPQWNLYDEQWPLWAYRPRLSPAATWSGPSSAPRHGSTVSHGSTNRFCSRGFRSAGTPRSAVRLSRRG